MTQNSDDVAVEPASKKRKYDRRSTFVDDGEDEEGPACNSCRKRKTKCSRQQPCSHCARLDVSCTYDEVRDKPGMKMGAIESLNQRVATVEQMILGQAMLFQSLMGNTSTMLPFQDHLQAIKQGLIAESATQPGAAVTRARELQSHEPPSTGTHSEFPPSPLPCSDDLLPPAEIMTTLIEIYFQQVHPWIPILHATSFWQRFRDVNQRHGLVSVLQAIVSVCLRFDRSSPATEEDKATWCLKCRNAVILQGMDKFSVENLQALVIVAFDIIGTGKGPSAWSVVGSMTRTVEQLQLSVEPGEDSPNCFLIRRMTFLRPAQSWVEAEGRRRLFWTVFLMDRFCSVATGWNISLTSADVHRRLPCEGLLWAAEKPVITPCFGIVDRPGNYPQGLVPVSERESNEAEELNAIGGFAFAIEASESLNLVTRFFLQCPIKFDDSMEVQMWLIKFKELDLRLVKWRLFLPPKWRNASVVNQDGIMDPNLTLAHMTHNTAVVQLHQATAYPVPQWRNSAINLPSQSSAETCLSAACEITTIAQRFLAQSNGITNPQFSFCLFIAGRVLLAHAAYYGGELHSSLATIVDILGDIAERWAGTAAFETSSPQNLASRFQKRLQHAIRTFAKQGKTQPNTISLDVGQPAYAEQVDGDITTRQGTPCSQQPLTMFSRNSETAEGGEVAPDYSFYSPDSMSLAFPPLPYAFEQYWNQDSSTSLQHILPTTSTHQYSAGSFQPQIMTQTHGLHSQSLPHGQVNLLGEDFSSSSQQTLRVSTFADPITDPALNRAE